MEANKKRNLSTIIKLAILGAVLTIALLCWYIAADREINILNDDSRRALGGTYISLSDGITHYELTGTSDGPTVVLIHGATIPSWDWDPQMSALTSAGLQVLRYDMFGRGWSDRPNIAYDRSFYYRQLSELIDKIVPKKSMSLVGHSFGGAVSVNFAAKNPKRVNRVALISPVINSVDSTLPFIIAPIPILGRFIVRLGMVNVTRKRARALYKGTGLSIKHYDALYRKQTEFSGFEAALQSMFKTDAVGDYRDNYKTINNNGTPMMLIRGTKDKDITAEAVAAAKRLAPNMETIELKGIGHSPNLQAQKLTNKLLVEFLTR